MLLAAESYFELPLKNPVLVFMLVLMIILLAPPLMRKIKVPGLVGLILAGMAVGPNGFNVLLRDKSIILFGTIGLLYIMFLAGLELDRHDFQRNRVRSLIFGSFTFFIPLGLGYLVCHHLLHLNQVASLLLASMFSTHTLVSYPIVSRLGLTRNEAVTIAVGGTIITDTAVLIVLAFISASAQEGGITGQTVLWMILKILAFGAVVLVGFPRLGSLYFRSVQAEGGAQYLFVLLLVFAAGFLAELAGVEPIIGAFLAGLALNPLVPHSSKLMHSIEFIGNTLFIPFFLLSVGMIVDVKVLFSGPEALIIAAALTITAIITKWAAAILAGLLFRFTRNQRNILFGLSSAHAAATLAVVMVGYEKKFFGDDILNGTILLILFTCVVSSFVTEAAARKLALETQETQEKHEQWERIMVPLANPNSVRNLLDFAFLLRSDSSPEPLFPLAIVSDDEQTEVRIRQHQEMVKKLTKELTAGSIPVQHVSRVDLNIASGIARAAKEILATDIVLGWSAVDTTRERLFGTTGLGVVSQSAKSIWLTRLVYPLNTARRIVVAVPDNAELEAGFGAWLDKVCRLAKTLTTSLHFLAKQDTWEEIAQFVEKNGISAPITHAAYKDWQDILLLSKEVTADDLFIVVTARPYTISYHAGIDKINRYLSRHFTQVNFITLYPEQNQVNTDLSSAVGGINELIA